MSNNWSITEEQMAKLRKELAPTVASRDQAMTFFESYPHPSPKFAARLLTLHYDL